MHSNLFKWAPFLVLVLMISTSCLPLKSLFLGMPDNKDAQKLNNVVVAAKGEPFVFHTSSSPEPIDFMINDRTTGRVEFQGLNEVLSTHKNNAFLIIRNDTLLYERYGDEVVDTSLHTSFSVAKSFTTTLLGIAIAEGWIEGVDQKVTDFLPEFEALEYGKDLTLKHLMAHTSGITFHLKVDAHLYYGRNMRKGLDRVIIEYPPGSAFSYANANTQLLGIIIELATGRLLTDYLQEKIWQPLQMESDALWAVETRNNWTRSFCCLNATARDYAKIARLYLNEGNWNGEQVVDREWILNATARNTDEGSPYGYNYNFRVGLKAYADYAAPGMYQQYWYVHPGKKIIIVSFNNREKPLKAERVKWFNIFRQIVDQL